MNNSHPELIAQLSSDMALIDSLASNPNITDRYDTYKSSTFLQSESIVADSGVQKSGRYHDR